MIYIQKKPKIFLMDNRYLSWKTYPVSQVMMALYISVPSTYNLDRYAAWHLNFTGGWVPGNLSKDTQLISS